MNEQQLHDKLRSSGIAGIGDLDTSAKDPFVVVEAGSLVDVLTFLRDDTETCMEMLHNVTVVQRGAGFEVVYHVCSIARHHALTLKVALPRPEGAGDDWQPTVPTASGVYSSADWHEREQWDLLGVHFEGHPDLRRIMTDYGFIGHPFRKDFPLIGNVEVSYDEAKGRVAYQPVSIESRTLVPRVIRDDSRYQADDIDKAADDAADSLAPGAE